MSNDIFTWWNALWAVGAAAVFCFGYLVFLSVRMRLYMSLMRRHKMHDFSDS